MTTLSIEQKYNDAIDFLNEHFAYFLTHVLNIGHPSWSPVIPTACVALREGESDFEFIFNPEFGDSLSTEDFAFILAHETMHILLDHLSLFNRFDNKYLANIAADCCINDYLVDGGFEPVEGIMYGEKVVGFNCANASVTEVYNILEKQAEDMQKMIDEYGQEIMDSFKQIDDHGWIHDADYFQNMKMKNMVQSSGADDAMPDDLREIKEESFNSGETSKSLGKGEGVGTESQFIKDNNVKLQWTELLKKLSPDIFRESGFGPTPLSSFRAPRRKLTSMYPKVILPIYEDPSDTNDLKRGRTKAGIVIALDTSSSIGDVTAQKFIRLAQSIPTDKIKLFACTFTTRYEELDLENPKFHSGGTDFTPVEQYIRDKVLSENDGNYPLSVVVITDGEANFSNAKPNKEQAKSWHWLLQDRSDVGNHWFTSYVKPMFDDDQIDFLENYI